MSIASEITKLNTNLTASYTACSNKGATLPASQNFDNLASTISAIPAATEPTLASLTITPSTTAQTITPPSGTDGYNTVIASAVTASIDNNITAGNIKDGVSILGVTGTYEGSGGGAYPIGNYYVMNDDSIEPIYFFRVTIGSLTYSNVCLSTDFTTMNGTESGVIYTHPKYAPVDNHGRALSGISYIEKSPSDPDPIDISNVKHINLSGITGFVSIVGANRAFRDYFTSLKSIDLSRATSCSLKSGFVGASLLESVDLSSLSDISTSMALSGSAAIGGAFAYTAVTTLSFPSLNSNSFGSYTNQFNNMLRGVTGCTVHFPSNLQSVIGSWASVTSGFGGTNTTVLFDLPATT